MGTHTAQRVESKKPASAWEVDRRRTKTPELQIERAPGLVQLARVATHPGNAARLEAHAAALADRRLSGPARADLVRQLQQSYGNRYVQRLVDGISQTRVQAKLTVGPAGDKYEQEADRVAKQVMGKLSAPNQEVARRQGDEEDELQMKPQAQRQVPLEGGEVGHEVESTIQQARGGGKALPDNLRSSMEGAFGADFSGVRLHTGSESDALNESMGARAFTTGQDVFVRREDYNPGSSGGQELLAHELTHVVQQGGKELQLKTARVATGSSALVQAHPSHAKEKEVKGKFLTPSQTPDAQRHPSHAKEKEVRAKHLEIAGAFIVQRDYEAEKKLGDKYGITIGLGPKDPSSKKDRKRFSSKMLKVLDTALATVPKSHLTGSYLKNIVPSSESPASSYSPDTKSIDFGSPAWLPSWLHAAVEVGGKFGGIIDWVAVETLRGLAKEEHKGKGISLPESFYESAEGQSVFGGVFEGHSEEKLAGYTLRHELGHAVDDKINFTSKLAHLPEFGGWKQYVNPIKDQPEAAVHFLERAGITYYKDYPVGAYKRLPQFVVDFMQDPKRDPLSATRNNQIANDHSSFPQAWKKVMKSVQSAQKFAWMLKDGGKSELELNGRVIDLDHYGTWVSYLTKARDGHAVSNYQFSSPGEWFAEAYAAFYDPNPDSKARKRLNKQTIDWFTKNLGERPSSDPNKEPETGILDFGGQLADLEKPEQVLVDLLMELLPDLEKLEKMVKGLEESAIVFKKAPQSKSKSEVVEVV